LQDLSTQQVVAVDGQRIVDEGMQPIAFQVHIIEADRFCL